MFQHSFYAIVHDLYEMMLSCELFLALDTVDFWYLACHAMSFRLVNRAIFFLALFGIRREVQLVRTVERT